MKKIITILVLAIVTMANAITCTAKTDGKGHLNFSLNKAVGSAEVELALIRKGFLYALSVEKMECDKYNGCTVYMGYSPEFYFEKEERISGKLSCEVLNWELTSKELDDALKSQREAEARRLEAERHVQDSIKHVQDSIKHVQDSIKHVRDSIEYVLLCSSYIVHNINNSFMMSGVKLLSNTWANNEDGDVLITFHPYQGWDAYNIHIQFNHGNEVTINSTYGNLSVNNLKTKLRTMECGINTNETLEEIAMGVATFVNKNINHFLGDKLYD